MSKFNPDRIRDIAGEINAALAKLDNVKKLSKDEFLASQEKIDGSKYNLIVVMEGAIDLCNHISAKAGGRAPSSYTDCFSILEELKLFSAEFTEKLKRMAKFRNFLIHRYRKVDNAVVFGIIKDDISIVKQYLQTIDAYVKQQMAAEEQ